MELQILVAHGSNQALALEEPFDVGPNVRPSVPVAIQWNLAILLEITNRKLVQESGVDRSYRWTVLTGKRCTSVTRLASLRKQLGNDFCIFILSIFAFPKCS